MAIVDSHGSTNINFPKNPLSNETGVNRTVQSMNQLTTVKSPQPQQTVQSSQSQATQHSQLQIDPNNQPLQPQTVGYSPPQTVGYSSPQTIQHPQPQMIQFSQPQTTTIKQFEVPIVSQSTGQRMQPTTNKLPKDSTTLSFEPSSTPVYESINKNEVNSI